MSIRSLLLGSAVLLILLSVATFSVVRYGMSVVLEDEWFQEGYSLHYAVASLKVKAITMYGRTIYGSTNWPLDPPLCIVYAVVDKEGVEHERPWHRGNNDPTIYEVN